MFLQYAGKILQLSKLSQAQVKGCYQARPMRLGLGCRSSADLRLLRPASPLPEDALTAPDAASAARLLAGTQGNILLTTGAKELAVFGPLGGQRLIARVLPSHEGLDACAAAGIPARNIVAMQGPFTREMNEALLRQFSARYLVTKDGGEAGGFGAKVEAARAAGVTLVVIRRPADGGASYEEVLDQCRKAVASWNR